MRNRQTCRKYSTLNLSLLTSVATFGVGVALLGSQAHAATDCVEGPPGTFLCTGDFFTPQEILDPTDPLIVQTGPGGFNLTVDDPAAALEIESGGNVSVTDTNASTIINTDAIGTGLSITSGTLGSGLTGLLDVNINSDITSGGMALDVLSKGNSVNVVATGDMTSNSDVILSDAVRVKVSGATPDSDFYLKTTGTIIGRRNGIYVDVSTANSIGPSGKADIIIEGDVTGETDIGVDITIDGGAYESGTANITTFGDIKGLKDGIHIDSDRKTLDVDLKTYGTVTGEENFGIAVTPEAASNIFIETGDKVVGGNMGIFALNGNDGYSDARIVIRTKAEVEGQSRSGVYARNTLMQRYRPDRGPGSIEITTEKSIFGETDGIDALNNGIGEESGFIDIQTMDDVTGNTGSGIIALNRGNGRLTVMTAAEKTVKGGIDGITVDNQENGDLLVTVNGLAEGGTGAGVNNVDTNSNGGVILINELGRATSDAGMAVLDADGATRVTSRGALDGTVKMNGGSDLVQLVDGSATDEIDMGADNDAIEIYGAGSGVPGAAWDDPMFSGAFQNNFGLELDLNGGDGIDYVQLFGVTADSKAFGTAEGMEALALSQGSLVQINNGDLRSFGSLFIDGTSILRGEGNSPSDSFVGSTGNQGIIDLLDDEANDTITVDGDYAGGTGSEFQIDATLDEREQADVMIITGSVQDVSEAGFSVSHDQTVIAVNDVGNGIGAATGDGAGNGIRVVDVSNTLNTQDGDYALAAGPIDVGVFTYVLDLESDGIWYLQSEIDDQGMLYPGVPYHIKTFGRETIGTYYERTGTRIGCRADNLSEAYYGSTADLLVTQVAPVEPIPEDACHYGPWARILGAWSDADGQIFNSGAEGSYDETMWAVQGGLDAIVAEGDAGHLTASVFLHYGKIDATAKNETTGLSAGSTDANAWGGGGALTFVTPNGFYVDGVLTYTRYDFDFTTSIGDTGSTDANGWAVSGEAGWRIALGDQFAVTPQGQLLYQGIDVDSFIDSAGLLTSVTDADSLEGRLGATLEYVPDMGNSVARLYAEANVVHEFLDNPVTTIAGTPLFFDFEETGYEVGVGAQWGQKGTGFAVWAEGDYRAPFSGDGLRTWSATGGVAYRF